MPKGRPKRIITPEQVVYTAEPVEKTTPNVSSFQSKVSEAKDRINSAYIDSFYSYFIYKDKDGIQNYMLVNGHKWNPDTQSVQPTVIKIDYKMPTLTTQMGDYHPGRENFTNDKIVKTTIRSTVEYQSGNIQEWTIRDDSKLERVECNPDGSYCVVVEQEHEKMLKDHIKINKGQIVDSLTDEELIQLLAKRKAQGVHEQQHYKAQTPGAYQN